MKLLLALGNPESRYDHSRHNVGFASLDDWAIQNSIKFQEKSRFKASVGETIIEDRKVILAKPSTYYNNSGESMRALADFYQLEPQDILIIADDLALPFGTIRTRLGGSGAGSNGIKSINQHGGEASMRLRIGVWNSLREQIHDADFVLSKFSRDEQEVMPAIFEATRQLIDQFISGKLESTTKNILPAAPDTNEHATSS